MLHSRKLYNIAFFLLFSIVDACAGSTASSAMEKDSLMRVQDSIAELFRIDEITLGRKNLFSHTVSLLVIA